MSRRPQTPAENPDIWDTPGLGIQAEHPTDNALAHPQDSSSEYQGEGPSAPRQQPSPGFDIAKSALATLFQADHVQVLEILEFLGRKELGWKTISQIVKISQTCQRHPHLKQGKVLAGVVKDAMEGNEESAEVRARAMAAFEELGLDIDGSEETLGGLWSRKMKDARGDKRRQGTRGFGLEDQKNIPKQSRSDAREGMKQEADEFEPGALGDLVPGTRMRPERRTPG